MVMKEILIPAIAILTIFGAPIIAMWVTVLVELLEKPRWTVKGSLNINEPEPCLVRAEQKKPSRTFNYGDI
jgi:hypothetical protein